MRITLNGKETGLPEGVTVAGLIALKKLNPKTVIVEYNHELVKEETWADIVIKENDKLEVLRFVGGG
ncbi:MAG: Sulfur carrier protein ThiS [Pelotomaculum sp. PtaU1.Bin035]|nr:MAG: Sulfur carrier protein ThiS [Pelotomaculum sp. PtaU1.Bin035]